MTDERKLLTRQNVYQKLLKKYKYTIFGNFIMLLFGSLIFGMIRWMLSSVNGTSVRVSLVLIDVLWLAFAAVVMIGCVRAFVCMINLKRVGFSVVADRSTKIEDNKISPWKLLLSLEFRGCLGSLKKDVYNHTFEFESGKKMSVTKGTNSHLDVAAEFCEVGDVFWVVFRNDVPQKVLLLYSTKMYDYKD